MEFGSFNVGFCNSMWDILKIDVLFLERLVLTNKVSFWWPFRQTTYKTFDDKLIAARPKKYLLLDLGQRQRLSSPNINSMHFLCDKLRVHWSD